MKSGYTLVAWIVFMGCFGLLVANQCATFTDLKLSTVAEKTVSLSFKIANTCSMRTTSVRLVAVSVERDSPPHRVFCQVFVTDNGACTQTDGCTCDDQGTFRVMRKLDHDKPEIWILAGELTNDEKFNTQYQVWAGKTTIPTFPTLAQNSTSSAAKNTTKLPDEPPPTNTSSDGNAPPAEETTGENKTGVTSPTFGDAFAKFADSNEFIYVILGSIGGVVLLIVVFTAILCHVLCRMKKNERAPMRKFRSRVARGARRTVDSVAMVFNLPWQKERDDDY